MWHEDIKEGKEMQASAVRTYEPGGLLSDLVLMKLDPAEALLVLQSVGEDACLSKNLDLLIMLEEFVAIEGELAFGQRVDNCAEGLHS
jgi:hypothetical protein